MSSGGLLAAGLVLVSVIAGVFYVRVISIIYEKAAWGDRLKGILSKREWLLLFPWVLIGMFAFYLFWLIGFILGVGGIWRVFRGVKKTLFYSFLL